MAVKDVSLYNMSLSCIYHNPILNNKTTNLCGGFPAFPLPHSHTPVILYFNE